MAPVGFAVLGVDHPHALGMAAGLLAAGAVCRGYWTPDPSAGAARAFAERFPQVAAIPYGQLVEDPSTALVATAAVPDRRAGIAVDAMRNGKDVLTAKPGCLTLDELALVERTRAETGRLWSVWFSERLASAATVRAARLVAEGAVGRVVHVLGLGPHRLDAPTRPGWFFDAERAGGILADLAAHQADQFLQITGADPARVRVVSSASGNLGHPEHPRFADFGDVVLAAPGCRGYARVDWFTPDGLPTWGDGRLVVTGTDGYLEVRKYVDLGGRPGGDHLFLADGASVRRIDCTDVPLTFFPDLLADVAHRTETALPPGRAAAATALALRAQRDAEPCDSPAPQPG
ncbi:Gfo/Idh/MocA family protein [Streptomyces sp. NPDC020917]|uniref:Gfo/Idh/MocA family protein n=1 Tax=Streptomyces sp. NPDC020917 TaxID=3365102 RepID=UPI00379A51AB